VPLAVVGLSPVWLYFNTLMTTYGIDLQCAPIVAWLLWRTDRLRRGRARTVADVLLGAVVMGACLMWPVCVLYVPVAVGAMWILTAPSDRLRTGAAVAAGGVIVFAGAAWWLHNAGTWLHDPAVGSGVFRGGGGGFLRSPHAVLASGLWMLTDLAVSGTSYYFWLPAPDCRGVIPLVSLVALAATLPALWRAGGSSRLTVAVCVGFAGVTGLIAAAAGGPPGLRRGTSGVAALYALYVFCWHDATSRERGPASRIWSRRARTAALELLLLHHVIVLPSNAQSLRSPRPATDPWFAATSSPDASLARWRDVVLAGSPLDCRGIGIEGPPRCRYSSIYAAVTWSLAPRSVAVRAFDLGAGHDVVLTPEAWPATLAR